MDDAMLELRLVGDIAGTFRVARYQRGYRWGHAEVQRLLDDLWESKGAPYNLQPVVVKRDPSGEWELVDGQQRLTTLLLLFSYMKNEGLQSTGAPYSIRYDTRPGSEAYLRALDPARAADNIDFFHISGAYEVIRNWFANHKEKRQYAANKLYGYLFESVRVLWYEAPSALDSTTLFTRLNVGRIPLTEAELFKALLLSKTAVDRRAEVAAQWDAIERDLQRPDVWAFIASGDRETATRITLLLDAIAGGPRGRDRSAFQTFDTLRARLSSEGAARVWDDVVQLHGLVMGWYESRDDYHKVGYLVAIGHVFADLVVAAKGLSKSALAKVLNDRIRASLDLAPSDVAALSYEDDRKTCERLLLLFNVEFVRRQKDSSERYPFRLHRSERWSLEHIHAQHSESLRTAEQWKAWLTLHRDALAGLDTLSGEVRAAVLAEIDAVIARPERRAFETLASKVEELLSRDGPSGTSTHSLHSISNLALLSSDHNSALNNAVFEVKRRRILDLDRARAFVPPCTRMVFLKYFTDADAQQVHFWSNKDRDAYLAAILSTDVGVGAYLKAEGIVT